jgi:hypothetical protein
MLPSLATLAIGDCLKLSSFVARRGHCIASDLTEIADCWFEDLPFQQSAIRWDDASSNSIVINR